MSADERKQNKAKHRSDCQASSKVDEHDTACNVYFVRLKCLIRDGAHHEERGEIAIRDSEEDKDEEIC